MWKTVALRIRGAAVELENAGLETEGMATSTSKLREQVAALTNIDGLGGFDIMQDDQTFKSTYDIILGIGKVWKEMSDIDQAALLELLAGKRQGNALSAALTNLDDLQAALKTSQESAGSAQKEYDVWLTSIDAKVGQFKAAFEALSTTVVNSDFIKSIVTDGTNLLQVLDNIIQKTGGFGTFASGLTAIMVTLRGADVAATFRDAFNFTKTDKDISKVAKSLRTLVSPFTLVGNAALNSGGKVSTFFTNLEKFGGTGTTLAMGLGAAALAITAIVAAYQAYQRQYENLKKSFDEAKEKVQELSNAYDENNAKIQELIALKNSGDFSSKDAEELALLQSQNAELAAQIQYYNDLAEAKGKSTNKETDRRVSKTFFLRGFMEEKY